MSQRAVLERLCLGTATAQALAAELGLDEPAVRTCLAGLREAGAPIVESGDAGFALAEPLQLLDGERILEALDAGSRGQVQSICVAFETASTQADALAAPTPRQGCAIFLAERQTHGQGRRGRNWESPLAANLYMSISRRFAVELSALAGLSLVVGVAAAEALNARIPDAGDAFAKAASDAGRIGVKWPNDLVADGKKLGGILIQLRADAAAGAQAVIGIGINVRMPAANAAHIDQAWCDLHQLGAGAMSRNELAAAMLDGLLPALEQFEQHGLAPFLPRWQRLDSLAGKPVRIIEGTEILEGTSFGISDSGALRLRQGERERLFHSGEVSLRPA